MTEVRHSRAYALLAEAAGREANLKAPTPAAVAADPSAREIRDALWIDYESRLADERTYTLDEIRSWLSRAGADVAKTSVFRDRRPILARRRRLELSSRLTQQFLEATAAAPESEILAAARRRVAQHLFDFFLTMPHETLEATSVSQVIRMMEAVGSLSRAGAETDLAHQRLTAMRRTFDEEVKAAAGRGDGRLTKKDIDEIRETVFGSAA